MRRATSIADIARAAGVSHSTVSRALRNSPLISTQVRQRIGHLAREMGYTPNAIAQSLQTRRSHTIGLVVTSIADPFLSDVVNGVEEMARPAGFSVFLSTSHNDPDQEMAAIETFHRRRVDGILIESSRISQPYKERLDRIQVPTVLVNSQAEAEHDLLHWVAVDDREGARLAVEHLLQLGHRAIGYLGAGNRPRSNRQRFQGYQRALAAARLPYRDTWVVTASSDYAPHEEDVLAAQALLPQLLDAGVTAVFCYNDMIALGVLMSCRERGVAVPEELSVVGFDDIELASYVTPPLTTIQQPKTDLGRQATQLLLDLLDSRAVHNRLLAPTLMRRASTSTPALG